jgi:hypothetical protein
MFLGSNQEVWGSISDGFKIRKGVAYTVIIDIISWKKGLEVLIKK